MKLIARISKRYDLKSRNDVSEWLWHWDQYDIYPFYCPIEWAACIGNLEIVQYLYEYGANIHFNYECVCCNVIYKTDIVKYLMNMHDCMYIDDVLQHAIDERCIDIIPILIESGANINNVVSHLGYYAGRGNLRMVKCLIENGVNIHEDDGLLVRASSMGHFDVIKYLVENGANIGDSKKLAMIGGHYEIVKYFIDKEIRNYSIYQIQYIECIVMYIFCIIENMMKYIAHCLMK